MSEKFSFDHFEDLYLMEKHRVTSFRQWPFSMNTACNIEKMAAAGFYWNGNEHDSDTVTCFVCFKTLDGWQAVDDPWEEHAKHAPQCLFVKYNKSEAELTVKEFLKIFTEVMQNHMVNKLEIAKKKVLSITQLELSTYLNDK